MIYQAHYNSPLGGILLSSDEEQDYGLMEKSIIQLKKRWKK